MLPASFVTCSGRVVSVTFFLLEESDCSRLGASSLVSRGWLSEK